MQAAWAASHLTHGHMVVASSSSPRLFAVGFAVTLRKKHEQVGAGRESPEIGSFRAQFSSCSASSLHPWEGCLPYRPRLVRAFLSAHSSSLGASRTDTNLRIAAGKAFASKPTCAPELPWDTASTRACRKPCIHTPGLLGLADAPGILLLGPHELSGNSLENLLLLEVARLHFLELFHCGLVFQLLLLNGDVQACHPGNRHNQHLLR